ncbi:MAG: hypothetical protein IIV70_01960 [Peptococcaceae bacterium]|nr:hypothetical protein [Peptococcaceae bacterium]
MITLRTREVDIFKILKLTGKKIKGLRFGILPIVMFLLMTFRTLTDGNAVMLTGLCVAFLPFFAQVRSDAVVGETYTKKQDIFSSYFLFMLFITVGMLYLKGLTLLGEAYVPGYEASSVIKSMFLLTYVCDVAFVSVMVPFTCELDNMQKLMLGILLANLEIGFMVFANKVLTLLGDSFVLHEQWGIYFIVVTIVAVSQGIAGLNIKGISLPGKKKEE